MSLVIEYGNEQPHEFVDDETHPLPGPLVTTFTIDPYEKEDGSLHPAYIVGTDAVEMLRQFAQNPGPVKQLGGNELVQDVIDLWPRHSDKPPTWVAVVDPGPYDPADMQDLERFISEYWGIPRGRPGDLEQTYHTQYGNRVYAPGEAPPQEG